MTPQERPQLELSAQDPPEGVTPMPWTDWRRSTPARIALGRAGVAIPTDETLRFGLAHAMARDAIHTPLDTAALQATLEQAGHGVLQVRSQAGDRTEYLRRPDLGRRLAPGWRLAPVVLVQQARVAVADEVGEALGARLSVILIGERPGLSSPDSLGIYLTHDPRVGRHDAQRNCISNVRPEGLSYPQAAHKLAWLIRQALQRGLSGVALKDDSEAEAWLPGAAPRPESLVSTPPSSQEKT